MVFYCQKCNTLLDEIKFCGSLWMSFLKCNNCGQDYLQVADPRWIFPLQPLEPDIMQKALSATKEQLKAASDKIEMIDYKTVSIEGFKKVLLGTSDSSGA